MVVVPESVLATSFASCHFLLISNWLLCCPSIPVDLVHDSIIVVNTSPHKANAFMIKYFDLIQAIFIPLPLNTQTQAICLLPVGIPLCSSLAINSTVGNNFHRKRRGCSTT